MIERIQATNFRRYEDFELVFDEGAQLILIDGANGAGKTTILEAIHFALWGEGRSGRRNLDQLVRRGAELEGMQVEVVVRIGEDRYTVNRRRDGRSSTAVLYCNGEPLVEGPNEVSEEVGRILGMDASGFRLAVTAQQGDLEGLVSLRPAERNRMVARLLRLDAIAAARSSANDTARQERTVAQSLQNSHGVDESAERVEKVNSDLDAAVEAESLAAKAAAEALAAAAELEPAYREQQQRRADREKQQAVLDTLRWERDQLADRLTLYTVADTPGPHEEPRGSAELEREIGAARLALARAEASTERAQHRRSLEKDIAEVQRALDATEALRNAVGPEPLPTVTGQELREAESAEAAALALLQVAENDLSRASQEPDLAETCPTCEQEVSEEHREAHRERRNAAIRELQERLKAVGAEHSERRTEHARLRALHDEHAAEVVAWRERSAAARSAAARDEDAERRLRVYRDRVANLPAEAEDPEPLRRRVAELEAELALARKQESQAAANERRRTERDMLRNELERLEARLKEAGSGPSEDTDDPGLAKDAEEYELLLSQHAAEKELRNHWSQQVAILRERLTAATQERDSLLAQEKRRQEHQRTADAAAGAARILASAATTLSQTIRPELEASLARLLSQMSEGRFPRAAVGEDYEIFVEDDGQMRGMEELSGGEKDLVALALRIALSQTFTTHSGEGAGFLILDECFGSQDPDRRRSILDALRELRGEYRQLFIISHVEGLEDAADAVLHVERAEGGPSTVEDRR